MPWKPPTGIEFRPPGEAWRIRGRADVSSLCMGQRTAVDAMKNYFGAGNRPEPDKDKLRVPVPEKVEIVVEDFVGFISQYAANISLGGAFIATDNPKPVGSQIDLLFRLADNFSLIQGRGEVAWVRSSGESTERPQGMGVRFVWLDPASQELVQKIVNNYVAEGGTPFQLEAQGPVTTPSPAPAQEPNAQDLGTVMISVDQLPQEARESPPEIETDPDPESGVIAEVKAGAASFAPGMERSDDVLEEDPPLPKHIAESLGPESPPSGHASEPRPPQPSPAAEPVSLSAPPPMPVDLNNLPPLQGVEDDEPAMAAASEPAPPVESPSEAHDPEAQNAPSSFSLDLDDDDDFSIDFKIEPSHQADSAEESTEPVEENAGPGPEPSTLEPSEPEPSVSSLSEAPAPDPLSLDPEPLQEVSAVDEVAGRTSSLATGSSVPESFFSETSTRMDDEAESQLPEAMPSGELWKALTLPEEPDDSASAGGASQAKEPTTPFYAEPSPPPSSSTEERRGTTSPAPVPREATQASNTASVAEAPLRGLDPSLEGSLGDLDDFRPQKKRKKKGGGLAAAKRGASIVATVVVTLVLGAGAVFLARFWNQRVASQEEQVEEVLLAESAALRSADSSTLLELLQDEGVDGIEIVAPEDNRQLPPVTELQAIDFEATDQGTTVTLVGNRTFTPTSTAFVRLSGEPPEDVVKILGVEKPYELTVVPVQTPQVKALRVGFHRNRQYDEIVLVADVEPGSRLTQVRLDGIRLHLVYRQEE